MSPELFVIEQKPALDEQEQQRLAYLRDKHKTAGNLGLVALANSIKADIITLERGSLITTAPMSDTELTIWSGWLPTVYSDITDDKNLQLANYHFDRIPSPVLKMWEKHKQSGLFERFEIWTPEILQPDPILVGVNGNTKHLLARWGESDANLVSFDDIKRELVRRWHNNEVIGDYWSSDTSQRRERTNLAGLAAVMIGSVSCIIAAVLLMAVGIKGEAALWILFPFGTTVAVGTFIGVRRLLTKELWRSSALMQAIAKDNSRPRELISAT